MYLAKNYYVDTKRCGNERSGCTEIYLLILLSAENGEVETECPVGTKCVADHFCNEDAVMVLTRVQLTPAQKRNRGKLIVSSEFESLNFITH